jgi:hypothetical protein
MRLQLVVLFLGLGAASGALHFALLARDASLLLNRGTRRIGFNRSLRLCLSSGMLVLAALSGSLPLLAALAGVVAARQWAIGRYGPLS